MTAPIPTPIGVGPAFHPPALSRAVSAGAPAGGFRCGDGGARFGVHLELFAAGRVVIVPAGIGVAPPWRRDGAYVRSGRCSYAARTREPTGGSDSAPCGDDQDSVASSDDLTAESSGASLTTLRGSTIPCAPLPPSS